MSEDYRATQDLVRIAEDGQEGYAKGAEELTNSDRPELAAAFTRLSHQRATFSSDLHALAASYGDSVDKSGSVAAALHRGWMAIRDAITGSGPESVLKTAIQGEEHAISAYEKALQQDISPETRLLFDSQLLEIRRSHQELEVLLANAAS
jgi:uncharacterized protein (TIGR02284 family)